jgi:uncharacterized GH25 family protein
MSNNVEASLFRRELKMRERTMERLMLMTPSPFNCQGYLIIRSILCMTVCLFWTANLKTVFSEETVCGRWEASIRRVDGTLVMNAEVRVIPRKRSDFENSFNAKTDDKGVLRFAWPSQTAQFFVHVPGVGVALSSPTGIPVNKSVEVSVPWLVPYGSVSGRVLKSSFSPGDKITIGEYEWEQQSVSIQSDGAFRIDHVVPGRWPLEITHKDGGKPTKTSPATISVLPRQSLTSVVVDRASQAKPVTTKLKPRKKRPNKEPDDLLGNGRFYATGKVTDKSGRPIENSRVVVINQFHGGLRMNEEVFESFTDDKGQWRVDNLLASYSNVVVAAFVKNYPVVYGHAPQLLKHNQQKASKLHVERDLVVSDDGANIRIHVLHQGQPVKTGMVRLSVANWSRDMGVGWARTHQEHRELRDSIWQFTKPIDQTGHVTFENLPSGEFEVTAINGRNATFDNLTIVPVAKHTGLCLAPGVNKALTIQISQPTLPTRFRIHTPEGSLIQSRRIGIQFGQKTIRSTTSRVADADGILPFSLQSVGIHELKFTAKDVDIKQLPVTDRSCYLPYVAAGSSLYPKDLTTDIHLLPLDYTAEATIQLRDIAGKPMIGAVSIIENRIPIAFGATNKDGEFSFSSFGHPRRVSVNFCRTDVPAFPPFTHDADPEKFIKGATWQSRSVRIGDRDTVAVYDSEVGFLKGRVEFPDGINPADYSLPSYRGVYFNFDEDWNFTLGPLHSGRHNATWRFRGGTTLRNPTNFLLMDGFIIHPGKITHTEIRPKDTLIEDVFTRDRSHENRTVAVFLPDSEPAVNATVLGFFPVNRQLSNGKTNALGQHSIRPTWVRSETYRHVPGTPRNDSLVVWVPGVTAKRVIEIPSNQDDDLTVNLEIGHRVKGTVTINGKSALSIPAPIKVHLAHQGLGRLDDWMSFNVTADAYGEFEFNGVTPGDYVCQASLEELWLSDSIRLNVAKNRTLTLKIPELGQPTIVQFTSKEGTPLRGHNVEVQRPSGPLTRKFQSAELTTDGKGTVTLHGCSYGTVKVRLQGQAKWSGVKVLPLGSVGKPQVVHAQLKNEPRIE